MVPQKKKKWKKKKNQHLKKSWKVGEIV
jgi:hypothetical protein